MLGLIFDTHAVWIYRGFVSGTGAQAALPDLIRYLRAMVRRLEKPCPASRPATPSGWRWCGG